ncbi:MAG TPA: hypothetical protein VH619_06190 [Verrucomicrobiae bacterium]|nr:hypothetical protein [Verrucomicrobiae bacterium]
MKNSQKYAKKSVKTEINLTMFEENGRAGISALELATFASY